MNFLSIAQQVPDIDKKLAEAPNSEYEIGVLIGSFLPVVVLILLAYLLYSYMKRNKNSDQSLLDD